MRFVTYLGFLLINPVRQIAVSAAWRDVGITVEFAMYRNQVPCGRIGYRLDNPSRNGNNAQQKGNDVNHFC